MAVQLPLAQLTIPRLTADGIADWLKIRRLPAIVERVSGHLHGALVAYGGVGLAFIDGADESIERRFTLAHEVGHFVGEYLVERSTFQRIAGEEMLEVHDRRRSASGVERTRMALAGRPLPLRYWACTGQPAESEQLADRIAVELLAPTELLLARAPSPSGDYWQSVSTAALAASDEFAVPSRFVEAQIDAIWRAAGMGPAFGESRKAPAASQLRPIPGRRLA